jgi:hypothetical protein
MTDKIKEVASTILETAAPKIAPFIKISSPVMDKDNKKKNGQVHFKSEIVFSGVGQAQAIRIAKKVFGYADYSKGYITFDAPDRSEAIKKIATANKGIPGLIAKDYGKAPKNASKSTNKTASSTPIDRVKVERKDLETKCNKLDTFLETDKFKSLDVEQRKLLRQQKTVMKTYLDILDKRMKLMEK